MAKYRVARCDGWPIANPSSGAEVRPLGEEFESDSAEDAKGAESGYLEVLKDSPKPKPESKPDTKSDAPEPRDAAERK